MIVITGDTHGNFSRFSNKNLQGALTENDYIIIAGDCGLVWCKDKEFEYWKKWLSEKPFKTLFIDGNHENFDMLNDYDVSEWHGGNVHHIVKDKIIHLMRGQIYTIEDKKIFTFGGARSSDIQGGLLDPLDENFKVKLKEARKELLPFRVIGKSWWKQEMPSKLEMDEAWCNLEKHHFKVDYIVTHATHSGLLYDVNNKVGAKIEPDGLTNFLETISSKVTFDKWFCGHYHIDSIIDNKHTVLYKQLKQIS